VIEKLQFPYSLRKIEFENCCISFVYSLFINLRMQKYFKIYFILLCKNMSYYEFFQFASVSQGVVLVLNRKNQYMFICCHFQFSKNFKLQRVFSNWHIGPYLWRSTNRTQFPVLFLVLAIKQKLELEEELVFLLSIQFAPTCFLHYSAVEELIAN